MLKINLQEPQRNRNATANFVNLIRTSTVHCLHDSAMYEAHERAKTADTGPY